MKIIKLEIYSLQTGIIPKGEPKNWTTKGKLAKRARTAIGSFTEYLRDDTKWNWKFKDLEKYGYTNIYTGYIDNQLHLERNGEQYIAFLSMKLDNFDDFITLGFSSHK